MVPFGMANGFNGAGHQTAWAERNIMVKESVPIVLSCAVWGRQLAGSRVLIECDNSSVVTAVNKHYAREQNVMQLLRSLWFFVAHFDIDLRCKHIAGVDNSTADCLSRGNLHFFFFIHRPPASQRHYLFHYSRS